MGGPRRQRPGTGRSGAGRPAHPAGKPTPARREPLGSSLRRALNPLKTPTRSRTRLAALVFAALAIFLGVVGFTFDRGYLRPALLLAVLALLWGLRAMTMR